MRIGEGAVEVGRVCGGFVFRGDTYLVVLVFCRIRLVRSVLRVLG